MNKTNKIVGLKYLTADSFKLMHKIFSLVRWKMSNVDSFVHRPNTLSCYLLSQQLNISTHTCTYTHLPCPC